MKIDNGDIGRKPFSMKETPINYVQSLKLK